MWRTRIKTILEFSHYDNFHGIEEGLFCEEDSNKHEYSIFNHKAYLGFWPPLRARAILLWNSTELQKIVNPLSDYS